MRYLMPALSLAWLALSACGHAHVQNLPLAWRGADPRIRASASVQQAFTAVTLTVSPLRDQRPDPSVVGRYQGDGREVRTTDNVAAYFSDRFAEMLRSAGAQLSPQGMARIDVDIVELGVIEAGMFNGLARLRVSVIRNGAPTWVKLYEGKSKRWGRTHNPDNYNDALSNSFISATKKLLADEEFANALGNAPGTSNL